jgi:hypothetical protein
LTPAPGRIRTAPNEHRRPSLRPGLRDDDPDKHGVQIARDKHIDYFHVYCTCGYASMWPSRSEARRVRSAHLEEVGVERSLARRCFDAIADRPFLAVLATVAVLVGIGYLLQVAGAPFW